MLSTCFINMILVGNICGSSCISRDSCDYFLALALTERLFSLIPLRRRYVICIGDSVLCVWFVSTHFPKSKPHSELRVQSASWQHVKSDLKQQCI